MQILSNLTKTSAVNLDGILPQTPLFVDHGSDAAFVRPTTTRPVVWRGTVVPTGMIDGDDFIDASGTFVIHGGTP